MARRSQANDCISHQLFARKANTLSVMEKHNVRFPHKNEFDEIKSTTQSLFNTEIASSAAISQLHAITEMSIYIYDVAQDGGTKLGAGMVIMPLTEQGQAHLLANQVMGTSISDAWVAKPNDVPAGLLVWGMVGICPQYSGRILEFSVDLAATVYWDIPVYAYAVSRSGKRIMHRVGFRETNNSQSGLQLLDKNIQLGVQK